MASFVTYHRLMKFEGAQALEDHLAAFATQRVMNWHSQASVPYELSVIHKLVDAALARAADAWNTRHHALCKLPLELFELCWSFLDTQDLLRVSSACKLWRRLIHDTPALWTDLIFASVRLDQLSPLLERSRDSLFGLSVIMYDYTGPSKLAEVLRPHAHRLRRLELRAFHRLSYYEPVYMELSAPALRAFKCDLPRLSFLESNFIFSCPNLERMQVLAPLELHHRPMRFVRVTSLAFGWCAEPLHDLYDAFPSLVTLEITGIVFISVSGTPTTLDLPRDKLPPATLRHVVLRGIDVSYDDLRAFGFTAVRDLEIESDRDFQGFKDTLALFDALGGTPRSAAMQGERLVIRSDGPRNLRMSFDIVKPEHYCTVLSRPAVRENIRTLALPVEEPPMPIEAFRPHFFFPEDEFPALETLVLPVGHPMLDGHFMVGIGKLRAPALRRLAIIDTPRTCCDGAARRLDPLLLKIFITCHLELAPERKLDELIFDGDHGVALCEPEYEHDDGRYMLMSVVDTFSHRYWPEGEY